MGTKRRPNRVAMIRDAVKRRTRLIRDGAKYRAALRRISDEEGMIPWNDCNCAEIAKKALGEDDE